MESNPLPKIWLCGILDDKRYDNIAEMTSVWNYFDGLGMVLHKQGGDNKAYELLNERKKEGFIVQPDYLMHMGHARNHFLLNPRIKLNDWIIMRDDSERLNPKFCANIRTFITSLNTHDIGTIFQHGKILMFRRWFNQQFINGLHTGLIGARPKQLEIDKVPEFKDDKYYAYSLREETRPKDHRYYHELKYIIDYGVNGNHLQLFHNNLNDLELHQNKLAEFFVLLSSLNISEALQLIEYWQDNPLTKEMIDYINIERPFRNAYRFHILEHTNEEILKDEDEWKLDENIGETI